MNHALRPPKHPLHRTLTAACNVLMIALFRGAMPCRLPVANNSAVTILMATPSDARQSNASLLGAPIIDGPGLPKLQCDPRR